MPWVVRHLTLRGAVRAPRTRLETVVAADFYDEASQETLDEIEAALDDGWEPFQIVSTPLGRQVMWLRKQVAKQHGQYL